MEERLAMRVGGTSEVRVEVSRGGRVESVHEVDVAVSDAGGRRVAVAGRPDRVVFVRSALKPFQALPLVQDGVVDRFGLTDEQLALCCASHSGEPRHVEVAASILERIGLDEGVLACGPHEPFATAAARALREQGREPGRLHNNCSGKHAGMLALAVARGWPVEGYHELEHPVQQRILDEVERWTELPRPDIGTGVDGCGVVTVAIPVSSLAAALARLARAADAEDGAARSVVRAMAAHPDMLGGTRRLCTAVVSATRGRVIAKVGAEGVYGALVTDRDWGIALKVRDGARRAAEVALVAVLDGLGLLEPEERESLERWYHPEVRNTRDEVVGRIRPVLEWAHDE
jgi:L-asparaginase II